MSRSSIAPLVAARLSADALSRSRGALSPAGLLERPFGCMGSLLRRPSAGGRHGDLDLAALVYLKTVHQLDWSD